MIRFRYNKTSRSYRVRMDLQKNDKDLILMKFDTGASDTIITTGALGISKVQEDALLKSIQNEKLEANEWVMTSFHVVHSAIAIKMILLLQALIPRSIGNSVQPVRDILIFLKLLYRAYICSKPGKAGT